MIDRCLQTMPRTRTSFPISSFPIIARQRTIARYNYRAVAINVGKPQVLNGMTKKGKLIRISAIVIDMTFYYVSLVKSINSLAVAVTTILSVIAKASCHPYRLPSIVSRACTQWAQGSRPTL